MIWLALTAALAVGFAVGAIVIALLWSGAREDDAREKARSLGVDS